MNIAIPKKSLEEQTEPFRNRFCELLGSEASYVLTPEVQRALLIPVGTPVEQAVEAWRRPYELLQVMRNREDLDDPQVAATLNELKREPHGELALALSEPCAVEIE